MTPATIAAASIAVVLLVLFLATLRESFSERSRQRIAAVAHGVGATIEAVHRFFVKPQERKEMPSEPTV